MASSSSRLFLLFLVVASFAIQAMANSHESKSVSESASVDLADQADPPESEEEKHPHEAEAMAPASRRIGKEYRADKSVAGGGVIIGGLATVVFAAVFCYIRVTRKRNNEI